jgi:hypothetical protein
MYIPTDFAFVENTWVHTIKPTGPCPRPYFVTHEAVDFEVSNIKPDETAKPTEENSTVSPSLSSASASTSTSVPAPAPAAPAPVIESFSASGNR